MHIKSFRPFTPLLMAAVLLAGLVLGGVPTPRAAAANGVVGSGTAASCTPAALQAALDAVQASGGGDLSFDCGPAPHTIVVANTLVIAAKVKVKFQGGSLGAITLSGGNARQVIWALPESELTLNDMVITEGAASDGYGGCILANSAVLIVKHSLVHSCRVGPAPGSAAGGDPGAIIAGTVSVGGAIAALDSLAFIADSQVLSSTADAAGGLFSNSAALVTGSRIAGNRANYNGGGVAAAGELYITDSLIEHNEAQTGGGLSGYLETEIVIDGSRIFSNTASGAGGGLYSSALLTVTHSTLEQNAAGTDGGGLFVYTGTASLDQARILGNRANVGGGAFLRRGALSLTTALVEANTAVLDGGGIVNDGGWASLSAVTLAGNQADGDGGGFYDTGAFGASVLTNTTISGNWASGAGGGIKSVKPFTATNVTVAYNTSDYLGAGFYRTNETYPYHFANVMLVRNTVGAVEFNCAGPTGTSSNGLSSDFTCLFVGTSGVSLPISPLQFNGGLGGLALPTHLPLTGNPAIDGGTGLGCPPTDQRGAARPAGAACDVGAVEAGAVVPWLWLPVMMR